MNWIRKVKLVEKLRVFYYVVTMVLGIICVIVAFGESDGNSGFYGALIVLLFSSIAAIESVKEKPPQQRVIPGLIGIGLFVGAYLWLADEANAHPADLGLLGGLVIVWLLSALLVFAWLPVVLLVKSDTRKGN